MKKKLFIDTETSKLEYGGNDLNLPVIDFYLGAAQVRLQLGDNAHAAQYANAVLQYLGLDPIGDVTMQTIADIYDYLYDNGKVSFVV